MFLKRVALTGLLILITAATAFAQPYQVVDLGVLPGETTSIPSDINNALQVVGTSGGQAFVWDPVNGMRALAMTRPPRINNSGIIAGVRATGDQFQVVAIADGVEYLLPSPPDTITDVRELTDNNLLLLRGARTWAMAGGQFFDLTTLFGGDALAINEQGMVGGANANGAYLRLSDGRVIQPWPTTFPVSLIGPAGHFTGLGFYGYPDGTVVETPFRPVVAVNFPNLFGINRAGDVVGSNARFFEFGAFLYRAGRTISLGEMTVGCNCSLTSARAINDAGYIAGMAQFGTSSPRAVLLVPVVPAPPGDFRFTLNGRTVSLAWQVSPGALDYIIEAGTQQGTSDLFNGSIGDTSTLTVTVPPGRYFVRLRARNAVGVSEPTSELTIDVP